MRVVLAMTFIAMILADDKSFCSSKCDEKYPEGELRNACHVGCDGRASISAGPFAFVDCQRGCDSKFLEDNETKSETHSACTYACLLPMTSSVFMSVKYSDDGKPDVKIVRNNNGFTSVERPALAGVSDLDRFIANVFGDLNRQILSVENPMKVVSESQNEHPTSDDESSPDLFGTARARMAAMHNRMNEMLAAFSRQFFEGIRRNMQHQGHVAVHRPAEHDAYAHIGPEIGNILSNGEPMLLTHPTDGDDGTDSNERSIKGSEMSSNHPPSVFYWIMIVFGVGALLLTLYASVIFFRVMRSAAYRRISTDVMAGRCPVAPSGPGPIPVKKVPLDGWVERSEPSGVPPPAYDQVSIHSIQKQKPSDTTQQPHASHPESSSPSSDQK
ncbi:hypothetical protein V3C99_013376 [Haemonchus contortus]